jgi:hypothetical protein
VHVSSPSPCLKVPATQAIQDSACVEELLVEELLVEELLVEELLLLPRVKPGEHTHCATSLAPVTSVSECAGHCAQETLLSVSL